LDLTCDYDWPMIIFIYNSIICIIIYYLLFYSRSLKPFDLFIYVANNLQSTVTVSQHVVCVLCFLYILTYYFILYSSFSNFTSTTYYIAILYIISYIWFIVWHTYKRVTILQCAKWIYYEYSVWSHTHIHIYNNLKLKLNPAPFSLLSLKTLRLRNSDYDDSLFRLYLYLRPAYYIATATTLLSCFLLTALGSGLWPVTRAVLIYRCLGLGLACARKQQQQHSSSRLLARARDSKQAQHTRCRHIAHPTWWAQRKPCLSPPRWLVTHKAHKPRSRGESGGGAPARTWLFCSERKCPIHGGNPCVTMGWWAAVWECFSCHPLWYPVTESVAWHTT